MILLPNVKIINIYFVLGSLLSDPIQEEPSPSAHKASDKTMTMTQRLSCIAPVVNGPRHKLPEHILPLPEAVRDAEDAVDAQDEMNDLIAEETMRMQIPVNIAPPLCKCDNDCGLVSHKPDDAHGVQYHIWICESGTCLTWIVHKSIATDGTVLFDGGAKRLSAVTAAAEADNLPRESVMDSQDPEVREVALAEFWRQVHAHMLPLQESDYPSDLIEARPLC